MGLVIMRNYSIKLGGEAERIPLLHWGALTEWGSISPERVARAAKQALCGVNPFRFKKNGYVDHIKTKLRLRAV